MWGLVGGSEVGKQGEWDGRECVVCDGRWIIGFSNLVE